MARPRSRRGSAMIEFTLVGIPVIFLLISIFEIARGMWIYTTLAHAIKEGNRFAIVHGNECALHPNSCAARIRDVATVIRNAGVGLLSTEMQNVRFVSQTRTITCPTLSACLSDDDPENNPGDTFWPSIGPVTPPAVPDSGGRRYARIQIRAEYPFHSAIAMFWPGAGPGITFGTFVLPASSNEGVQY